MSKAKEFTNNFFAQGMILGEVFFSSQRQFKIPRYQRPYSWGKEQVQDFWSDLSDSKDSYFIGNIILNNFGDKNSKEVEIIDGQQRLLTITILSASIYDNAKNIDPVAANTYRTQDIYPMDLRRKEFYKIIPADSLKIFFKKNIQQEKVVIEDSKPKSKEERLVKQNYEFFSKLIEEKLKYKETDKEKIEYLDELREKIFNLTIINTEVGSEDIAYEVFESTNARGLDLSTADLLKNYIFKKFDPDERDTVKTTWGSIRETIEQSDTELKKFIRYYWISKYEFLTDSKLFRAIKKEISDNNWDKFINSLEQSSKRFNLLKEGESKDFKNYIKNNKINIPKVFQSIQNISLMNVSQVYVILLCLLRNINKIDINLTNVFIALEKFCFQYFYICKQPGNNVERMFSKYSIMIEDAVNGKRIKINEKEIGPFTKKELPTGIHTIIETLLRDLRKLRKTNVEGVFLSQFDEFKMKESNSNKKMVKYILKEIDRFYNTPEKDKVSVSKYFKSKSETTIDFSSIDLEHILPLNPDKDWGLSKKDIRSYVNMIGNLTILNSSYNRKASNKIVKHKINDYKDSKLSINKHLISFIEHKKLSWTEEIISDRQVELGKIMLFVCDF
tara:strand:- start:540 stop:2387 length:1848 start_codon:yes stop_codon:yes gene_type:complete